MPIIQIRTIGYNLPQIFQEGGGQYSKKFSWILQNFKAAYHGVANFIKSSVVSPHCLLGRLSFQVTAADASSVLLQVHSTLDSSFFCSFRVKLSRDRIYIPWILETYSACLGALNILWPEPTLLYWMNEGISMVAILVNNDLVGLKQYMH